MRIENIAISKLKPYENNPRHNDSAVDGVAESIRQFGFRIPMVIDANNVIVCGHTRYKAALKLGLEKVPCTRVSDLSEDQIKAFRLADNKVSEVSTWDTEKLELEIADIQIDMGAFGFSDDDFEVESAFDNDGYYGDERERTNRAYNLDILDSNNLTNDFWQMPIIRCDNHIPTDLIGFNYAKSSDNKQAGIHFYIDDYQFERLWSYPEKYIDILSQYDCILSPDFSLYLEMPMAMKIWNIYRSRQIGAYYQSMGIKVIPTISWAEKATYSFCFQGIPKNSIVSVSTIGVKEDQNALRIWRDGMQAMIEAINPTDIIIYGGKLDFDYGDIKTHYFENKVTENWKAIDRKNQG